MDTISIQLINPNAYRLLEDMEELGLIKISRDIPQMPFPRHATKSPMTEEEIDK